MTTLFSILICFFGLCDWVHPEVEMRRAIRTQVRGGAIYKWKWNPPGTGAGNFQAMPSRLGQWSVLSTAIRGGFVLPGGGGGGELGRSDYLECLDIYPADFCDSNFIR